MMRTSSASSSLDKHFEIQITLIKALMKSKNINALILQSEAGLGKSHITLQTLLKEKMREGEDFEMITGFTSPLELYHILYRYNGKIIIIDDVGSLLSNETCKGLLLSALWSPTSKRTINWLTTSVKLEAPSSFVFSGKLIFLVNRLPKELDNVKSRCYFYEIKFSYAEKIKMLYEMAKVLKIPSEVVKFIEDNTNEAYPIDFRLLVKINDLRKNFRNWKHIATKLLQTDERLLRVRELMASMISVNAQIKKFSEEGLGSRRTYFNLKKELSAGMHRN